ncbi:hypothetical protein Tco_0092884, partial [Tanacetum coccineum]
MDIQDEIKAFKENELPKSSSLPDSDQNKPLNKSQLSAGVKGIGRVSPMKLKVTGNSDSPRNRRDKLIDIAPVVSDKFTNLVKDNVKDTTHVKEKVQADVVKDTAQVDVVKDKAPDVVKHKAPAVGKKKPAGDVVRDT